MIPLPVVDGLFNIASSLINKLFPDPVEAAKAQLALQQMQAAGELDELKIRLSAILAEAQSPDPWTSRARPSFMYVIYIIILFGIPMGFISAYDPLIATNIATGFKSWLTAIPSDLYALFGVGYVGYTGFRSWDKKNGFEK